MRKQEIILSMQMAFLGAICNKVRLIAFDMTEELFALYVYIDSPLTDDEYEAIDSAVTDVLADFPNFLYEKIYIIENNDNILSLNCNMKLNSIQIYNFINFFKKNIQRGSII